jgi:hypothetical protein
MSTNTNAQPRAISRRRKLLFALVVWLTCLPLLYCAAVAWRAHRLYDQIKTGPGWQVSIHQSDPQLGYKPIPGVRSAQLLSMGPPVPIFIDSRGFRVPAEQSPDTPSGGRPHILFLGCSFTFGATCRAEKTFPQLVAGELQGTCMNAGVCGYGLTQMLLRARQLIPEYRPDIVVVQYSPWLVGRALSPYAPSYFGLQPVPYYTLAPDGSPTIAPPLFTRSRVNLDRYTTTPRSLGESISFLFTGGRLLLHDDLLATSAWIRRSVGGAPSPTDQRQAVVDAAYGELDRLCQQNGAQLAIVVLDERVPVEQRDALDAAPHATVIDAHQKLVDQMPPLGARMYQKLYCHWRGEPPVLVDHHPNARAHRIIADAILEQLAPE